METRYALEIAADAIREQDGGDPKTETGWKSDELLEAWEVIRAMAAELDDRQRFEQSSAVGS